MSAPVVSRHRSVRLLVLYLAATVLVMFIVPFAGPFVLVGGAIGSWLWHEERWLCITLTVLAALFLAVAFLLTPF